MAETEREILTAFHAGVNYYDTAYIYPGSEAALGEILEKNSIREQVSIATKLPHYLIQSAEKMESLFAEQLKRLRTDYIDYYLMHMLTDADTWDRLKSLGILEWLEEKRNAAQFVRWVSLTMEILRCSAIWWTLIIGTSARFSTIIWTSTPRPDGEVFTMLTRKASL